MENRELERRLQRRGNAPVNHRQLAQALQEEWYTIHMPIFAVWLTQWDGYAIMWSSHERGIAYPPLKNDSKIYSGESQTITFFFKIKFLLKTKLITFLSIERGISVKKLEILNFNTTWIKQCERVMRTFIFFAEFIHIFAFLILQATTVQDAWYRISKLKLDLDIDLNIGFVSKNHMLE